MESNDARLHYIRSIRQLDKMYNDYFNSKSLENGESDYYNTLANSMYRYFYYDLDNMLFLCSVALMGLNKENIEDSVNHQDYQYNFKYSVSSFDSIVDAYIEKYKIPKENRGKLTEMLKVKDPKKYSFFNDERLYPTPYDKWLRVDSQDIVPNFTWNYLSCVRNALMHSEYSIKEDALDDKYSYMFAFCDISNCDYKNLKGQLFIPNYLDFIKFYYSSMAYYGIIDSMYSLQMDASQVKHIENEEQLTNIINNAGLVKMSINNKTKNRKSTFEYKRLKEKGMIFDKTQNNKNINYEEIEFNVHNKEVLLTLIKQYYGEYFYTYDLERQYQILYYITSFINNPKMIISSCIIAIYENVINVGRKNDNYVSLSCESYCLKASFLILKAYAVLYRLQNECFEEIDYSKMNLINYTYTETDPYHLDLYNSFITKLNNNGIVTDEDTYKKRYITEIIRNSLAHGNISIDFDIEDEKVKQYLIFDDKYKGKSRKLKISLDEFHKYLSSNCFSREETKTKEKGLTLTK